MHSLKLTFLLFENWEKAKHLWKKTTKVKQQQIVLKTIFKIHVNQVLFVNSYQ